jgi:hypothetical protein
MSVTFSVQGNSKDVIKLTTAQLQKALFDVATAWHRETVETQLGKMIYYNKPGRTYRLTGRLRSSIVFVTPTTHGVHTYSFEGGSDSYTPPKAKGLEVLVGTNVEYAPALHDGVNAQSVTVRAHTRRTKTGTVNVQSHTRNVPARGAYPFISQAGYNILPQIPGMITRVLNEAGDA